MSVRARARSLAAPVGRPVRRAVVGRRTRGWAPHSRLLIVQEGADWVLAYEAAQLRKLAESMGILVGPESWAGSVSGQSIFHESQFALLLSDFERLANNLGVTYFHGRPGTPGFPEFDACFETMSRRHREIDRVQVTNAAMEAVVLETGIAPDKLHRIPIGIDVDLFSPTTPDSRRAARDEFGLPEHAFVVGSFQKDGVGWGEGLEPKLIKGPDVLLAAAERLRESVPELWFLLTGPARGFVATGLQGLGIPYRHRFLPRPEDVVAAYHAIDLYVVASREEGGPKAVLESMATGVPVVTTRVGQATDLVRHGVDAFMVDVEDADALAGWSAHVARMSVTDLARMHEAAAETARANSYAALRPRWRRLLDGFVSFSGAEGA